MIYRRYMQLDPLLERRSLFLFGPRQTGKTTFLRASYPQARYVDLLDARTFRELSGRPELLRQSLKRTDSLVIVDEIQKLPQLLDEIQLMIDSHRDLRFILTGSSARKLKRGGGNLMAGRALTCNFHPLVSPELDFGGTERRLRIGSLPAVYASSLPWEDLRAYTGTYLQEEIQAEGLTRSISGFSRFLETAALDNAQVLNFTAIGSDCGLTPRTVQNYYQILEDTLVGTLVPPFRKTRKRKAVATSKFYFFDIGVANALVGREQLAPRTPEYGIALEHLILLELRAYLDYSRNRSTLAFWRTYSQAEVDFVVGGRYAIEVKAAEQVDERDLRGLRALSEEVSLARRLVVCNESWPRTTDDGIEVLPVSDFLRQLWEGRLIEAPRPEVPPA